MPRSTSSYSEEEMSESDSHNYTLMTVSTKDTYHDEENDDAMKEENMVVRFVSSVKYIQNIVIGLLVLALYPLVMNTERGHDMHGHPANMGTVVLHISAFVFLHVLLSYVIFYTSRFLMNTLVPNSSAVYYINETDQHISFVVLTVLVFVYRKDVDFYLNRDESFDIRLFDIMKILFIASLLMGLSKVFVLKIRGSFNYNMYMNRVKRQLLENVLLDFLKSKDIITFSSRVFKYGIPWNLATRKNDTYTFEDGGGDSWRIIFKEFKSRTRVVPSPHESPREFARLVKSRARRISRKGEFRYLRDLRECAPSHELFRALLDYLGMSEDLELTYSEIYKLVERNYKEHFYLRNSIKQMLLASEKLQMIIYAFIVLVSLMCVVFRGSKSLKQVTGFFSAMFGVVIVFKESIKNTIDSIVLLFVIHPFGIGDRVFIKLDKEVENLVVSELNLVSTTFYRWDGTFIHIPNFVLLRKPILNIRRSNMLLEQHKIQVSCLTEKEKVERLAQKLKNYLRSNSEVFTEYLRIFYDSIENSNKLHLCIWVQFRGNWQNYELYLEKRGDFIAALNEYLRELGIDYALPVQKVKIEQKAPPVHGTKR